VDHRVIDRFLGGERGITSETLDRIGAALGLRSEDRSRKGSARPVAEPIAGVDAEAAGAACTAPASCAGRLP
jgi:hypothetical protein